MSAPNESPECPEIPLFSGLENTVEVEHHPRGLTFWWARKGVGFGSLYMGIREDGKFEVDTECMGAEFCAEVVTQAIEKALERQEKEDQS